MGNKHLRRLGKAARILGPIAGAYAAMRLGGWATRRVMGQAWDAERAETNQYIANLRADHADALQALDLQNAAASG